jgi:hypothetical protein
LATNWKFARRARACATCGRGFEEGEPHYSLLRLEAGIARLDRCVACFRDAPASPEEFFWRTRFARDPRRRVAIDVEALREAFTRLTPVEANAGLRYLVALLLLRKRALRLVETRRGEGDQPDRLILSPGKGSEVRIEVVVPAMSAEGLESLRTELRALLGIEEVEPRGDAGEPGGGEVGEIGGTSEGKLRKKGGEMIDSPTESGTKTLS